MSTKIARKTLDSLAVEVQADEIATSIFVELRKPGRSHAGEKVAEIHLCSVQATCLNICSCFVINSLPTSQSKLPFVVFYKVNFLENVLVLLTCSELYIQ